MPRIVTFFSWCLPFMFLLWIWVENKKITNYTTLKKPKTSFHGGVAGTYRRVNPSGTMSDHSPFPAEMIVISIVENGLVIQEFDDKECVREHQFEIGTNLWWENEHVAEFQISRKSTDDQKYPGRYRAMNEGKLRFLNDGNFEIESTYWERGLGLYYIPISIEVGRHLTVFEKIIMPDEG